VWELNRQLEAQQLLNRQTKARNALLDVEVRDLKEGTAAVEERARSDLGMIKRDEEYYQILEDTSAQKKEQLTTITPTSPVSVKSKK